MSIFCPNTNNEGELYIGITSLTGQSQISLLIQVAQGSANPDCPPEAVAWNILSENTWISLKDHILTDTTEGMLKSWIITFAIPAVTTKINTILSKEYIWFRSSVKQNSDAVCQIIDIRANAAMSVSCCSGNENDLVAHTLPPLSITKIVESVGSI